MESSVIVELVLKTLIFCLIAVLPSRINQTMGDGVKTENDRASCGAHMFL